jgi:hypothetical protein
MIRFLAVMGIVGSVGLVNNLSVGKFMIAIILKLTLCNKGKTTLPRKGT